MFLVAQRRAFDEPLDRRWWWLAARSGVVHATPGRVMLGVGHIETLPLGGDAIDSRALLGSISLHGDPGPAESDPRCHGLLPFQPGRPGVGMVPQVQWFASEGRSWVTVLGSTPENCADTMDSLAAFIEAVQPPDDEPLRLVTLVEHPTPRIFENWVGAAVAAIGRGDLGKVVLSRTADGVCEQPNDPAAVLERMQEREPSCVLFSHPSADGRFVGASPELLMERRGSAIRSHPLAGTTPLGPGHEGGRLLERSAKDLEEHRLVVDDIAARLSPLCDVLTVPEAPTLVELRSVAHLGTEMKGTLSDATSDSAHCFALLQAIHPTPAVAGVPLAVALEMITSIEDSDRGYFAGAVGWFSASGDGDWVLGIRGAILDGTRFSVRAGAGIVGDSNPLDEVEETRIKLSSILEAVIPGCSSALEARRIPSD